jgi:hypothetical protein
MIKTRSGKEEINWGYPRTILIDKKTHYICDGIRWCRCEECVYYEPGGESSRALWGGAIGRPDSFIPIGKNSRDVGRWNTLRKRYNGTDVPARTCYNITKTTPTRGGYAGGWFLRKDISIPDYRKKKVASGWDTNFHTNPHWSNIWLRQGVRLIVEIDETWKETWFKQWKDLISKRDENRSSKFIRIDDPEFKAYWDRVQFRQAGFMKEHDFKNDRVSNPHSFDWGKRYRNRRLFCPECVQNMKLEYGELKRLGWNKWHKRDRLVDYSPSTDELSRTEKIKNHPWNGLFGGAL